MHKPSELINFGLHFDDWSCVLLNEVNMSANLGLEVRVLCLEVRNQVLLLKDFQEVLGSVQRLQGLDVLGDLLLEHLQFTQGLICEVLWRWSVVLHAL